jgi:branched-chain amino acid transport system permease protein
VTQVTASVLARETASEPPAARPPAARRLGAALKGGGRGPLLGRYVAVALVYLFVMNVFVDLSPANILNGIALGSLYGIIGVALVLVYRTNRIINFAAAAIGAVPAIFALSLTTSVGVSYLITFPIALAGGLLVGALTDILVIRRFANAPRLIVTVVTIGLAQSYAVIGFFLPIWFGQEADAPPVVRTPWIDLAIENSRGEPVLSGNQIFAFLVVGALTTALSLFFSRSRMGMALRASAENAERASLLGIPVKQVGTIAWALAGMLGSLAIFAQAPLIGVPSNATLGFDTLLYGLAAAVVAGMEKLGTALFAGTCIGVLIFASVAKTGSNDVASGLMLVVILAALLLQRSTLSRAKDSGVSTWQAVKIFRPVPAELRNVPEVRTARAIGYAVALAVAVIPALLIGESDLPRLILLPLYGMIAVSLVVLTGWAGQISLGQFGLVGIGAAVAGGIASDHNIDFFIACFIGIAAGAIAAVIVGLPAIRIQGLYLAVTTLAFGYAMTNYILNESFPVGRFLLPDGFTADIRRPMLYGRWDLENDRLYYFVCLGALVLVMAAALAFRTNHSGRVIIAMRDNQKAASSLSVNPVKTRLAAFAVSGGIAGLAGTLFAYLQHDVIPGTYDVQGSIFVFLAASVAGLTSVWAATVGVILFEASVLFGPNLWQSLGPTFSSVVPLLLTGPLLILQLYQEPGGLAGYVFGERDKYLRKVANRHGIHVPSLVADRLLPGTDVADPRENEVSTVAAEHSFEEVLSSGHEERPVTCPTCSAHLTLAEVAEHEHFKATTTTEAGR